MVEDYEDDFFFNLIENDNNFNYIGSFRLPPERTYYRKPKAGKIGVNGEGYIDQVIEWEESDSKKYDELIRAVTEIGLFKTIQANKMKGGRFELNVQVNENSELASLTDVGFGISQFLPIIVADLQMEDDSCLAISQPEIHLHPKIQATLGDYFCKQVNNTDKQYIVETHSEYLINRMRLLIVKGKLKPEDVKLYYMENDGIKTTTYAIELTTDGQIKNAPQGFFDTYEMDVMDIALYASA
jgi:predicted ATPase